MVGDSLPPVPGAVPGPNPLVTLASEFFQHDYFNAYAFGDGVVDSNNPEITSSGQIRNTVGTGFSVGGGLSAVHALNNGEFAISYQGAYNDYQTSAFTSGQTQNLSLAYSKRLTRHLLFSINAGGGIYRYGSTFFTGQTTDLQTPLVNNPFAPESKYASVGLGITYQQTRRLSYSVFGSFFLVRYNYAEAVGTTGASGGAAINYRLTSRDTLSVSYGHSFYNYQGTAGQASIDNYGATLTHAFRNNWVASVYGGAARSNASGTIEQPVTLLVGDQAVGGYILGHYNQTVLLPSFYGTVSHSRRHSVFSVNGGEGVAGAGNGYFLASRSVFIGGVYSYTWARAQNISLGGTFYRLTSVANTVSTGYSSADFSVSYGRALIRHVGMFLRYDYVYFGALSPYNSNSDNRLSFGFNFSSRSVPLTLF